MDVDLAQIGRWLSEAFRSIEPIVVSLAAAAAAIAAWRGVHAWRAQIRGTARHEAARQLLHAVYRVREAVREARAPGFWLSLGSRQSEDQEQFRARGRRELLEGAAVLAGPLSVLQSAALEAEVVLGASLSPSVEKLSSHVAQLAYSIQKFVALHDERTGMPVQGANPDEIARHRARAYGNPLSVIGLVEDEYQQELLVLIREIESKLRPHLGTS